MIHVEENEGGLSEHKYWSDPQELDDFEGGDIKLLGNEEEEKVQLTEQNQEEEGEQR